MVECGFAVECGFVVEYGGFACKKERPSVPGAARGPSSASESTVRVFPSVSERPMGVI